MLIHSLEKRIVRSVSKKEFVIDSPLNFAISNSIFEYKNSNQNKQNFAKYDHQKIIDERNLGIRESSYYIIYLIAILIMMKTSLRMKINAMRCCIHLFGFDFMHATIDYILETSFII